jgi:uncharacterized membrane protein HdeD (DUF308 family)
MIRRVPVNPFGARIMSQLPGRYLGMDELRQSAGWFIGLGVLLVVLGMAALAYTAVTTIISVVLFGWLLLMVGALQAAHAMWRSRWGGFFIELCSGVLYAVVGLMIVAAPQQAAEGLTLLIAVLLIVGGIFRLAIAVSGNYHHWGWLFLSGLINLLLGVMIWRQWPLSGLWVIGVFVGIDMIFNGWTMIMLGTMARKLTDAAP